jgi:hypothetical protein
MAASTKFEKPIFLVAQSIVFFCFPVFSAPVPGFSYEQRNYFDTSPIYLASSDNQNHHLHLSFQKDSFEPISPKSFTLRQCHSIQS